LFTSKNILKAQNVILNSSTITCLHLYLVFFGQCNHLWTLGVTGGRGDGMWCVAEGIRTFRGGNV